MPHRPSRVTVIHYSLVLRTCPIKSVEYAWPLSLRNYSKLFFFNVLFFLARLFLVYWLRGLWSDSLIKRIVFYFVLSLGKLNWTRNYCSLDFVSWFFIDKHNIKDNNAGPAPDRDRSRLSIHTSRIAETKIYLQSGGKYNRSIYEEECNNLVSNSQPNKRAGASSSEPQISWGIRNSSGSTGQQVYQESVIFNYTIKCWSTSRSSLISFP